MSSLTYTYLEGMPVGAIKPYANNPRAHSKGQIKRLRASIEAFGFTTPILLAEDGELIAGHGRLEAAKALGLSTVRAMRIDGLSAGQKKALRIADNRLAERSSWSPDQLRIELEEIIALDDTAIELTGFDAIEIDQRLTLDGPDADDEPEIAPPPKHPVSRQGDLWSLGPHRLLCGDARDPLAYDTVLDNEKARQTVTDIPFNLPVQGHISGNGRHHHDGFAMASGEMTTTEFKAFLHTLMTNACNASLDGSPHYWFIDWRSVADMIEVGREVYGKLKNVAVWAKPNPGMGAFLRSQHEMVPIFKHGTAPHVNNVQLGRLGRNRSNLWPYPGASGFSRSRDKDLADHPTVKPTRMIADAIRDASNRGDLVLDPCAGSGTLILAAEQVGRRAAAIEIAPKYIDVALRRYQDATAVEPVLLPYAAPLSEVRKQRLTEGEVCEHD